MALLQSIDVPVGMIDSDRNSVFQKQISQALLPNLSFWDRVIHRY